MDFLEEGVVGLDRKTYRRIDRSQLIAALPSVPF